MQRTSLRSPLTLRLGAAAAASEAPSAYAPEVTPKTTMPSLTIASGTLLSQVFVLVILALGAALLSQPYGRLRERSRIPLPSHPALILGMTLFTLVPLLLSHGFAPAWRPLVGTLAPSAISDGSTMLIVLVVDVLGLSVLVAATGGSQQSPFQAVYFLLPTLALFLRQSPTRVLVTAAVVFASFSVLMGPRHFHNGHGYGGDRHNAVSYWFVSMASLAVAVYIGLATTPP